MHEYDLDLEDEELFEQTKQFPYIVTKLPKVWSLVLPNILLSLEGAEIPQSELRVSGAEVTCLLLMLALLLYSVVIFFRTWKKNYRMPDGVFYFEEKIIQKTVKRMFWGLMNLSLLYLVPSMSLILFVKICSTTDRDTAINEFCALEGYWNVWKGDSASGEDKWINLV